MERNIAKLYPTCHNKKIRKLINISFLFDDGNYQIYCKELFFLNFQIEF